MRSVLLLGAAAAGLALSFGCGPENECNGGDAYCGNGVAHNCGSEQTFSSYVLVWKNTVCTSNACAMINERATCVLDEAPDQRCVAQGSYCPNNHRYVECYGGYRIKEESCFDCNDGGCIGALGDACEAGACAAGLTCASDMCPPTQTCSEGCNLECTCPAGNACPECAAYSTNATGIWTCADGRCVSMGKPAPEKIPIGNTANPQASSALDE